MGKNIVIEVCVDSLNQAKNAERLGADRIELCSRLDLDGLTPDRDTLIETKKSLKIPSKIMIRPRSGNFIYNNKELSTMESEIDFCKNIGIKEVVFGVLDNEKKINLMDTNRLVNRAFPMKTTFHKAIDKTHDIIKELNRLCENTNINSVLTSGGGKSIIDQKVLIKKIMTKFSSRINIILAGSITKDNFNIIHNEFGALEYHGKAILGAIV